MNQQDMVDHLLRYKNCEDDGFSASLEDSEYDGQWAQDIVLKAGKTEMFRATDKCEPEDALFCRNFNWIIKQLHIVYQLGKIHAMIDYAKQLEQKGA